MELLVRNAEGNVTQRDREYAAAKLGRLDRYFHRAQRVEMVHREEKLGYRAETTVISDGDTLVSKRDSGSTGHRIEITVFADGFTIRGEDSGATVREAIDKVGEKLESRLKRLKGRLIKSHRHKGSPVPAALEEDLSAESDSHAHVEIRERKTFLLKPMSAEEAALQMEMVDHPFFVFKNEVSSQVEVLYKRRDGRYGILQPEL